MGKQACDMMGIEWKYGCSNKYAHVRDIFHNNGCEWFFFLLGWGYFSGFLSHLGAQITPIQVVHRGSLHGWREIRILGW